ncbi:MAG: aryl-sulfate sulfotransferase [Bacteroidia bacterium]
MNCLRRILFACLLLPTCVLYAQPSVTNVQAFPHPDNVLRYQCTFSTTQSAYGFVEYYFLDGSDTIRRNTDYSNPSTAHSISIIGLLPQMQYWYRAVAFDSTGCYPGQWGTFTPDSLNALVTTATLTRTNTVAGPEFGYFLANTTNGNPDRYAGIYDRKGRLVWYQRMPGVASQAVDGNCQGIVYAPGSRSVLFSDCGRITEISLNGTTTRTLNIASLAPGWMPYQDVYPTSNGNWLVLAAKVDTVDKSSVGGDPNALVVGPGILEFDAASTQVWSWSAFDHLNPLTSPSPGGDWVPKYGAQAIDWLHANSVMLDGDGNPMLSFTGTNQVVKIARQGGNVVWTSGDNGDIEILPLDSFQVLGSILPSRSGYYLGFDRSGMDSLSRVVEWWIDFSYIQARYTMSQQFVLPTADFSPDRASLQKQSTGNYTVMAANGHSISELASNGNLLWRAESDSTLQRVFWLGDLYHRVNPEYLGDSVVCAHDSLVILQADPPGGIWSGPFVSGDTFNVAAAGAGFFPITYKWGPESLQFELMVDPGTNCGVGFGEPRRNELGLEVWPNPFGNALNMAMDLPKAGEVSVEIWSLDGRMLHSENLGKQAAGRHEWALDTEVLNGRPTGAYLLVIRGTQFQPSMRRVVRQ